MLYIGRSVMSFTSVFISLCHDIFVDYLFPVRYLSNLCGNFVLLILWWFMKAFVAFGGVIVSVLVTSAVDCWFEP